jgi:hypothetical protein
MTGMGLLARHRAQNDGRTNLVRLTERGRSLLEETAPRVAAADKRLLKLLGNRKREELVGLLQDLAKQGDASAVKAEEPSAGPIKAAEIPKPERKKKLREAGAPE